MALEQITDHVARGLARVITQFRSSQDVSAWVGALASEIQTLDDAIYGMGLALRDPAYAAAQGKATTLTLLGKLVGARPQGNLTAVAFQQMISAQSLANRSQGVPDDLIAIYNAVLLPWLGMLVEALDANDVGSYAYHSGPQTLVLVPELSSDQAVSFEIARNAMALIKSATPAGSRTVVIIAIEPCNVGGGAPIFYLDADNLDGPGAPLCAFDSPNTVR
jgi:hypothetical protein